MLAFLLGWLTSGLDPCAIGPFDGGCRIGGFMGGLAALLLGLASMWFLFPAVAIGVLGIFSDEVVEAVEARHYPAAAARARKPSFLLGLVLGLRSMGRLILWNLLAAPFYLLLLVTGIGPVLLFFTVNALALGRDLGEMVAVRHFEGEDLAAWLKATRRRRFVLGLVAALLFAIPFVNLLAPVLSAAAATHLFHAEAR
jgi:uncharacterized protein involved in cysteine biosynthesis